MAFEQSCRSELRIDAEVIPTVEDGITVENTTSAQRSGADITSYAECQIPLEWRDEDIQSKIDDFDPDSQSSYSLASIFMEDVRRGGFYPVMRGFVRGVRGHDKLGTATVHIQSPDALATAVPISERFENPSVSQVMSRAVEVYNENTPFNATFRMGVRNEDIDLGDAEGTPYSARDSRGVFSQDGELADEADIPDAKTFKQNRHTVSDVANWVCENTDGRWYFSFRHEGSRGLSLVYDSSGTGVPFTQRTNKDAPQDQQLADGGSFPNCPLDQFDVIKNDAIKSMFPVNTVRVMGSSGASIFGFESSMVPAKKFPFIEAQYQPLVHRANGQSVSDQIETDNVTIESATSRARKELQKRIQDTGTGEIQLYGKPQIRPYDTVTAYPTCASVVENTIPLTHQVASVRHVKQASSEYLTYLGVSPIYEPSEVEITVSEMRDV